ncbi:MAG: DUF5683 domain-containing protein [Muribaculum sp.]|nr:DUF5683 domain-containing protein [Muribaculaceae bacterium]MCM1080743.1 DUF5683 domain-containing protein [Muribaculum sp.]
MTPAVKKRYKNKLWIKAALSVLFATLLLPINVYSAHFSNIHSSTDSVIASRRLPVKPHTKSAATPLPADTAQLAAFPDSIWIDDAFPERSVVEGDSIIFNAATDSMNIIPEGTVDIDTCTTCGSSNNVDPDYIIRDFNPDPTRAVWLSALFPGLGQLYNRRYWKLPIVAGGFMGLIYGMSWNNQMLNDYTQAYRDLMDNDPSTKSYMDFYPPGTDESSLNKSWMEKMFKSRKDFYRRNRDLCVIGMIGVYLVAMVDAYVDASLTHFDISPDISFELKPSLIPDTRNSLPGVGLAWALNF